jgi:hypothetical protein
MTVSQDVFVTLRAESVFDALPTLNEEMIHPESLDHVKRAYDRVIAAAYKELPTSVVDQCRNLCAVLVARWLYQHSQESRYLVDDLGPGITSLVQFTRNERRLLVSALDVVNRLHPRGKDNEALKYDLRAVSDEDASLALHATGFVIREIGWAR